MLCSNFVELTFVYIKILDKKLNVANFEASNNK